MDVLLVTHDSFHAHETGRWHPERPERLDAAVRGVHTAGLPVRELAAPEVDRPLLERFHAPDYVRSIERFCAAGGGSLDPDTPVVAASWPAALRAAGAGIAAIDALAEAHNLTAFAAVRPPGHHALTARAMGFCLFNNVGLAAQHILDRGERVAIVDWDVHHGNGTEDSFASVDDVLYLSFHQHPFYPGTGWLAGIGSGDTVGTTVNVPVPAGTAGDVYRDGFDRIAAPLVRQFAPDWILVSAGYDAHAADPLAEVRLLASDYAYMAAAIHPLVGDARVIYFLEGGYDLEAIESSVRATLLGGHGSGVPDEPVRPTSPIVAWKALEDARASAAKFWNL
ncbi:MAG: histone deacetylase [Acidimicrobiia bacterium]|nr:histone deacetylase [Acidimicrobiia bacterium]